jgi:GxxExxY protein
VSRDMGCTICHVRPAAICKNYVLPVRNVQVFLKNGCEERRHPGCSGECMAQHTADRLNQITSTIIAAAIKVHRALGPGLLENAYLPCLCCELDLSNVRIERQKALPLFYRGIRIDCAYRADLIVEKAVLVEVKAMATLASVHERQLQTYLRLAGCNVGLLLNFGAPTMKAGIKRVANQFPD